MGYPVGSGLTLLSAYVLPIPRTIVDRCGFPPSNFNHPIGVVVPFDADILYGALAGCQLDLYQDLSRLVFPLTSTCLALHILHANLLTLPSARTTAGAKSIPNIFKMA